jgi:L-asparaginase II
MNPADGCRTPVECLTLMVACKGHWSDDHTFEVDWTRVGDNQRHVLTFGFEGRHATLVATSSSLGMIDRMTGYRIR